MKNVYEIVVITYAQLGCIIGYMSHAACRICTSDEKETIEARLAQKVQFRTVALEFMNAFNCHPHLLEQSIGNHAKKHLPKELTKEEQALLERVKKGEVSKDEMKRIIAARAFEYVIRNPHRLSFNHFIKLQQLQMREGRMKQKRLGQWGL